MSYILEALKKADADRERERSAVPSLHAHTDALGLERERRDGAASRFKLAAGAALLLACGAVAWWWMAAPSSTSDERPLAGAAPLATPPAPALAAAPAPVPVPAPLPVAAPTPPPVAMTSPMPSPAAPAPVAAPPAPARERKAVQPAAPRAVTAPTVRPAAEPRLPTRNELAPELRAALPPLSVSGAVYAPSASGRLLFVNGLVLREGDAVSDGLNVERIGRASSVLVFRGQRFELKH